LSNSLSGQQQQQQQQRSSQQQQQQQQQQQDYKSNMSVGSHYSHGSSASQQSSVAVDEAYRRLGHRLSLRAHGDQAMPRPQRLSRIGLTPKSGFASYGQQQTTTTPSPLLVKGGGDNYSSNATTNSADSLLSDKSPQDVSYYLSHAMRCHACIPFIQRRIDAMP
jgi:hypothetical protein